MYCFKNRGAISAQAQKLVEPLRRAPSINDFFNPLLRHEYSARGGRDALTHPRPFKTKRASSVVCIIYKRLSKVGYR